MRILLIEDDLLLGKALRIGLEQIDYQVDWVRQAAEVPGWLRQYHYDAVVLDLGLPDQDGNALLQPIRRWQADIPILIVTARDQIADRVRGLDLGADDFMVKPVDLDELAARLRAVIRRRAGRSLETIEHGALRLDLLSEQVTFKGMPVSLTGRELNLLKLLLDHRGQIISRQRIEDSLYGSEAEIGSNAIEVHIHHLRRKLDRHLIRTIPNRGYIIDAVLPEASAS